MKSMNNDKPIQSAITQEKVKELRTQIYALESQNLHKKNPKGDTQMVDEIIKKIKRFVEVEDK